MLATIMLILMATAYLDSAAATFKGRGKGLDRG